MTRIVCKRIFTFVMIAMLMLTWLPAKQVGATETTPNITFHLEESMKADGPNAKYFYMYDGSDISPTGIVNGNIQQQTKDRNQSMLVSLLNYDQENYQFVGWRINDTQDFLDFNTNTPFGKKLGDYSYIYRFYSDSDLSNVEFFLEGVEICLDTYEDWCEEYNLDGVDNSNSEQILAPLSVIKLQFEYSEEIQPYDITPIFVKKSTAGQYKLNITSSNNGEVLQIPLENEEWLVIAKPNSGFEFSGWEQVATASEDSAGVNSSTLNEEPVDYVSTNAKYELALEQDTTLKPHFAPVGFTLSDEINLANVEGYNGEIIEAGYLNTDYSNNVSANQRGKIYIPFQVNQKIAGESIVNIKVYEGEKTDGTPLYSADKLKFSNLNPIKNHAVVITTDSIPELESITVVMTLNGGKAIVKQMDFPLFSKEKLNLQFVNPVLNPNENDNEITIAAHLAPSHSAEQVLVSDYKINPLTGEMNLYLGAEQQIYKLEGNKLVNIGDLPIDKSDYRTKVIALKLIDDKIFAYIAFTDESSLNYKLIYTSTEKVEWKDVDESTHTEAVSNYMDAIILKEDLVLGSKSFWNGKEWKVYANKAFDNASTTNFEFQQFTKLGKTVFAVDRNDGIFKYVEGDWVQISKDGSNKPFKGKSSDNRQLVNLNSKVYILNEDGEFTEVPPLKKSTKISASQYAFDHENNIYAFKEGRQYYGASSHAYSEKYVYKLNEVTQQWVYQEVDEFFNETEKQSFGDPLSFKKLRPNMIETIIPIENVYSLFAGGVGSYYAYPSTKKITFNSNGGSVVEPIIKPVNTKIDAPTSPTKASQSFLGWYLDKELTKQYTFGYMPAKDIELYAKWSTVVIDLSDQKSKAIQDVRQKHDAYKKRDYSEDGWSQLTKVKDAGITEIQQASNSTDITTAMNKAISEMAAVPLKSTITVAVSMERFTLGQGYIIEPTLVEVPRNTQASTVITNLIDSNLGKGAYKNTGTVANSFYLSHVKDNGNSESYNVPKYILDAVKNSGNPFELTNDEWLGEFDFYYMSGWMYAINNSFPGVGAAGWTLQNEQVMRWQYTIFGYGADLNANNSQWGSESIVNTAQKDNLTWRVAEINSMSDKEAYLKTGQNQQNYDKAYKVLMNMEATQSEVDAVLASLGGVDRESKSVEVTMPAEAKAINDAIKALPTTVKLADKAVVSEIRKNYESLGPLLKQWIWKDEVSILEAAEKKITQLENEVENVQQLLSKLPTVETVKLADEAVLKAAQQAYGLLSKEQQALISNVKILSDLTTKIAQLKSAASTNEGSTLPVETDKESDKETDKDSTNNDQQKPEQGESPPTATDEFEEELKQSTGIERVQQTKDQVILEATKNAKELEVIISPSFVQQVASLQQREIVVKTLDGVAIQVPKSMFTTAAIKQSSLQFNVNETTFKQQKAYVLSVKEIAQNGKISNITLQKEYMKFKVPMTSFTNKETASVKALQETGFIARVVDGELKAVPHVIKDGEATIYANTDATFVFVTETKTFKDIAKLSTKEDIEFLANRLVVNGTSATTYSPNKAITRAQFAVMIARALNLTATEKTVYVDTKGKWYEQEVQALYEAGITNAKGNFNPNAAITREQAAAFMLRMMQYIDANVEVTSDLQFKDQSIIQSQFVEAIATLQALQIMTGKKGETFDPKGNLTRAQMAKILRKTLQQVDMM